MNNRHAIHFCRLLRPCCNWPRECGPAKHADKLPPPHACPRRSRQPMVPPAIRCMESVDKAFSPMLDNMSTSALGSRTDKWRLFRHVRFVPGSDIRSDLHLTFARAKAHQSENVSL